MPQQQYEQLLPVFVFPNQLTFYIRDPQSHRQIMTIYNPYDFVVSYEVLSTAPSNYSVQEPQGTLKPRCCIDIAIRRIELHHKGSDERFRVILKRRGGRSDAHGYRDVPSVVFDYRSDSEPGASTGGAQVHFGSDFRGFGSSTGGGTSSAIAERHGSSTTSSIHGTNHQYPLPSAGRSGRPNWLLAIVAVLCIVCLSAPTIGNGRQIGEESVGFASYFPEWFHLGVSQKLVAAYVLGLITAAFLQA